MAEQTGTPAERIFRKPLRVRVVLIVTPVIHKVVWPLTADDPTLSPSYALFSGNPHHSPIVGGGRVHGTLGLREAHRSCRIWPKTFALNTSHKEHISKESKEKKPKTLVLEKKNNMIQCCVWHYLQGFWVNPIGEMGQTGQHDQVLEEGTDPNLGCFCLFLDVLLDFCPSQTPLRQNGDKDIVLTSWESRSTATEWTCRNWQLLPWVLVLTVFCGLEPLGKALWRARKDSCIVSKQRRRVSSPDWGSKMRKRENELQRLLWKIIVLGGGAITSCHEHVFQGQSVSMTYNSHLSSICQLGETTFPPCVSHLYVSSPLQTHMEPNVPARSFISQQTD